MKLFPIFLFLLSQIPATVSSQPAIPSSHIQEIQGEISYKDCDGCHDGVYRKRFDYDENPICFECHNPGLVSHKHTADYSIEEFPSNDTSAIPYIDIAETNLIDMTLIPAGDFIMGNDDRIPDEAPRHTLHLNAFWIDNFETTNKNYNEFVKATGHLRPVHWTAGNYPAKKGKHPVTFVSWYDAAEYCEWRGKRLPKEAEWEKAARGTKGISFAWGNEFDPEKANMPQSGTDDTTPVGTYENGRSPYGLYDMTGNVYEWVEEWYYLYPDSPAKSKDFKKYSGKRNKILKGGSWFNCLTYECGISAYTYNRAFLEPITRNNSTGFRCALSFKEGQSGRIELTFDMINLMRKNP